MFKIPGVVEPGDPHFEELKQGGDQVAKGESHPPLLLPPPMPQDYTIPTDYVVPEFQLDIYGNPTKGHGARCEKGKGKCKHSHGDGHGSVSGQGDHGHSHGSGAVFCAGGDDSGRRDRIMLFDTVLLPCPLDYMTVGMTWFFFLFMGYIFFNVIIPSLAETLQFEFFLIGTIVYTCNLALIIAVSTMDPGIIPPTDDSDIYPTRSSRACNDIESAGPSLRGDSFPSIVYTPPAILPDEPPPPYGAPFFSVTPSSHGNLPTYEQHIEGLKTCPRCRVKRGTGSGHHCRRCDWCVDNFDHHCVLLGVCIAKRNHIWFVCLLMNNLLSNFIVTVASYNAMQEIFTTHSQNNKEEEQFFMYYVSNNWHLVLVTVGFSVIAVVLSIFGGSRLCPQRNIRKVIPNVTMLFQFAVLFYFFCAKVPGRWSHFYPLIILTLGGATTLYMLAFSFTQIMMIASKDSTKNQMRRLKLGERSQHKKSTQELMDNLMAFLHQDVGPSQLATIADKVRKYRDSTKQI